MVLYVLVDDFSLVGKHTKYESFGKWQCQYCINSYNKNWNGKRQISGMFNTKWNERVNELKEYKYKRIHGNCIVPRNNCNVPRNDKQLADWVKGRDNTYKNETLPEERITILEEMDFLWDPQAEKWNKTAEALKEYKQIHGISNVPQNHKQLDELVHSQRKAYTNKTLLEEQSKSMELVMFLKITNNWMNWYTHSAKHTRTKHCWKNKSQF